MPKITWTKSFNILTFFWPAKTVITIMVITFFWTFTISLVLLWTVYWSAKKVFSATTCNKESVPCFSDHFCGSCYFQSSPTERPSFHFGTKTTMKSCQVAELTPSFKLKLSTNQTKSRSDCEKSCCIRFYTRNVVIARPDLYVSVGITILCQKFWPTWATWDIAADSQRRDDLFPISSISFSYFLTPSCSSIVEKAFQALFMSKRSRNVGQKELKRSKYIGKEIDNKYV